MILKRPYKRLFKKPEIDITPPQGITGKISYPALCALIKAHKGENISMYMEELAELIQALSKYDRDTTPRDTSHIVEEMADVLITLELIRVDFGIYTREVFDMIDTKMQRNLTRIGESHD